jgi:DNA-binding NtrC family response regulator
VSHDSLTATVRFESGASELLLPKAELCAVSAAGRTSTVPLPLGRVTLGRSQECDLIVSDAGVSWLHTEVVRDETRVIIRDLGSKNGTFVDGVKILEAPFLPGQRAIIGGTVITLATSREAARPLSLSMSSSFGDAVGQSLAMRALFAQLERAAQTDVAVVLVGEAGTGKEVLARALHDASPRANHPFVVLDCRTLSSELIDSQIFGHEAGAFTGARSAQRGYFEEVARGTLLLDGMTELPAEFQAKFLRVLESRRFRRVGGNAELSFDARVVASAHADLRAAVRSGAFRADLYFRLAGTELIIPSLRERRDDIPLLVDAFFKQAEAPRRFRDLPTSLRSMLSAHHWPGNVRELKNVAMRLVLFPDEVPTLERQAVESGLFRGLPLVVARDAAIERFEREYIAAALKHCSQSVSRTAKALGLSRQYLHRLMAKYELGRVEDEP